MTATMECPDCGGKGQSDCFYDGPQGGGYGPRRCIRCKGSGQVNAAMASWIEQGRELRKCRTLSRESLSEMECRTGVSAATLSGMEMGRIEPNAALWDTTATPEPPHV